MATLELAANLATRWCYLPFSSRKCCHHISCKFGHHVAQLALVPTLGENSKIIPSFVCRCTLSKDYSVAFPNLSTREPSWQMNATSLKQTMPATNNRINRVCHWLSVLFWNINIWRFIDQIFAHIYVYVQFSTIVLFDTIVVVQGANISKWMAFTLYISFEIYNIYQNNKTISLCCGCSLHIKRNNNRKKVNW